VLLTKYLYLFIYTHNGDGTFQNYLKCFETESEEMKAACTVLP